MAPALTIREYTDPACPFAFSAEPVRWRLRWTYGEQLRWRLRMIGLTLEPGEAEKLAEGAPNLQRKFGMPIDPRPYPRPASSLEACLAVVAARLYAPDREEALLRRLRVRTMQLELLDEPETIAGAARDAGLDPDALAQWCSSEAARNALDDDLRAARSPSEGARARDEKLGGPPGERRYTAPSYEYEGVASLPGFHRFAEHAAVLGALEARPAPDSVEELLAWAGEPLATAEVAEIMELSRDEARSALAPVAREVPAGADAYWSL
jgi:predicted DsbA family dithiol-disulfide isomerase